MTRPDAVIERLPTGHLRLKVGRYVATFPACACVEFPEDCHGRHGEDVRRIPVNVDDVEAFAVKVLATYGAPVARGMTRTIGVSRHGKFWRYSLTGDRERGRSARKWATDLPGEDPR